MTINEGELAVPGGKVWYRVSGANEPGIPLLVVHGGPGAPHDYLESLADLCDERPVVFYDQLGCGRSQRPDDTSLWTLERFVAELAAVRSALALKELHILGQSWGATLAVSYLLAAGGDGVQSMILSGPLLSSPRWIADQRAWLSQLPQALQDAVTAAETSGDFESAAYQGTMDAYYRRHLCRLSPWPASLLRTFDGLGQQVYLTMWGPSEFTCTGTLAHHDLMPRLHEISVPTLLTCGRYDEATPDTTEAYCRRIGGAQLVIFEDASHGHHLEQPGRYLAEVRQFLSRSSGQGGCIP